MSGKFRRWSELSRCRIYDLRITIYEVFGVVEGFVPGYVLGVSRCLLRCLLNWKVGCWMTDAGCWMTDDGCWITDVGLSAALLSRCRGDVGSWRWEVGGVVGLSAARCLLKLLSGWRREVVCCALSGW